MDELQALILDHLLRQANPESSVRDIFAAYDLATVLKQLEEMLSSGIREQAFAAGDFIRDVVNYRLERAFTAALPSSGVFAALGENVLAPDYQIRSSAIFTLGKITFPRNAGLLRQAFPVYLARDPLLLSELLGELTWLSAAARKRHWDYLSAIARSPCYLARWSFFETTDVRWLIAHPKGRDARLLKKHWGILAQDRHPLVRAEARYWQSGAWRYPRGRQRYGYYEPSFGSMSITFRNYLHVSARADYDLVLFDAFVRYRVGHPFDRKVAHEEDARAFDRWNVGEGVGAVD